MIITYTMAQQPLFIRKENKEIPAVDFKKLLDEGISIVQQMAGERWTDYNIHDPGVTILEQLCYALTELGYRANFNFEDLLASQFNTDHTNDTYFSAARILPSSPITINDFRKLLIDRVQGLRNIWILPLNMPGTDSQVKGTYIAFAESSPELVSGKEEKEKLQKDIWDQISKYSNLAEAFEQVVILKRIKMFVQAKIDITYEADVDIIHAQVLFNLSRSMTRPLQFKKLETLLESDKNVNEIFDGPRLQHGFVEDKDLVKKITVINSTTFITPIKNVPGISHIHELWVYDDINNGPSQTTPPKADMVNAGMIDLDKIPVFANPWDGKPMIRYYRNKTEIRPNVQNVKKIWDRLVETARVTHDYSRSSNYDLPVPQGQQMAIGSYYSFQNHFPAIYGLGPMGLPLALRGQKKIAVLQLKGYLILFDQIMANYFAQLEHFSDLFSLDPSVSHTYFAGIIDSLVGMKNMVFRIKKTLPEDQFTKEVQAIAQDALQTIDRFYERRNRFLDHLLARFGERIADYGLNDLNVYYSEKEYQKKLTDIKIQWLSSIVRLSKNKARSFNQSRDYWHSANISAMEGKIRILLGLDTNSKKLVSQSNELWRYFQTPGEFDFGDFFSQIHAEKISPVSSHLSEIDILPGTKTPDASVLSSVTIDRDMMSGIFKTGSLSVVEIPSFYHHKHKYLLLYRKDIDPESWNKEQKDLLERMLSLFRNVDNHNPQYWIPGEKENYILEFRKSQKTGIYDTLGPAAWKEVGAFATRDEAIHAGEMLYTHIRHWNIHSEGFYLIDHLQLRPRSSSDHYCVHFSDKEWEISFHASAEHPISSLHEETEKLVLRLSKAKPRVVPNPDNTYTLYMADNGEDLGYATQRFHQSNEATRHAQNCIRPFFEQLVTGFDFFDGKTVHICRSYTFPPGITNADYSFRVTVVLPGWTARFKNKEFRQAMEHAFRLECPAHVGIDFKWVSYEDMMYFESIYPSWLEALKNEREHTGHLNTYSQKIMYFLKDMYQPDSVIHYFHQEQHRKK